MAGIVSRAPVLRAVAAAALAFVAVLLALAGRDVLAWSGQSERAEVAVTRYSRDLGVWEPDTWLPASVSRTLLRAGDDVELGRALQRVQLLRGRRRSSAYDPPKLELARLELELDELGRTSPRDEVRSRAIQLHSILFFQQLLSQGANGDAVVAALERTIEDLRRATRIDPENEEAQLGLEWLLDVYQPIAAQRAGVLAFRGARLGNASGGGGSPGTTARAGGF